MQTVRLILVCVIMSAAVGSVPLQASEFSGEEIRLKGLLLALKEARSPEEAALAEIAIENIWSTASSPTTQILQARRDYLVGENDPEDALDVSNFIVELDPDFVDGWFVRARLLYQQADYQAAKDDLKRLLSLEPRHYLGLSLMSAVTMQMGDEEAALKYAGIALEINPHVSGLPFDAEEVERRFSGLDI